MALPNQLRAIKNALRVQGPLGFIGVMLEKKHKRERYEKMLLDVPASDHRASFIGKEIGDIPVSDHDRLLIIRAADGMLNDENRYFTFPYNLRSIERPWNYDPFEKKHWPARHYTEQKLHDTDTPVDVKIIWEINRFKDLPTLAQAAFITREKKYADEIVWRLHSWIDDNPFASSINWASGLEIGIRLISWTSALTLLKAAGFDIAHDARIARSIYEQAAYLRAELSTDKIVPSNHLIGEAAGLLVAAWFWSYPERELHAIEAKRILEAEITRQTYHDGATREATTWYHGFVTDFMQIAHRSSGSFSVNFNERLAKMLAFRSVATQPDGTTVRIGDADDGHALFFEGDQEPWLDAVFGKLHVVADGRTSFERSGYAFVESGSDAMYVRGGEFGMGGDGSSSHAHDDLLAPVIWLAGLPVLVDPGTFVYNGAGKYRSRYRGEHSHNTFSLDEGSAAKQKLNFGWYQARPAAKLKTSGNSIAGSYGEWPEHIRTIELRESESVIHDEVSAEHTKASARLHLHPMWRPEGEHRFVSADGRVLHIEIEGWKRVDLESYDFSPSYRVQQPATKLILQTGPVRGSYTVRLNIL